MTKEHAMSHKLNSAIAVIGIDIGKNSFHIVGQDRRGLQALGHDARLMPAKYVSPYSKAKHPLARLPRPARLLQFGALPSQRDDECRLAAGRDAGPRAKEAEV
jgi:hypothetical protein